MAKRAICANDCKNYNEPVVYYTSENMFATQYAQSTCLDCGKRLYMWKNKTHPWWKTWKLEECVNHEWKLGTLEFKSYNPNKDYPFHLMIVALLTYKPIEYWVEKNGECEICGIKKRLKSKYDQVMENGQEKTRIHGWEPVDKK